MLIKTTLPFGGLFFCMELIDPFVWQLYYRNVSSATADKTKHGTGERINE